MRSGPRLPANRRGVWAFAPGDGGPTLVGTYSSGGAPVVANSRFAGISWAGDGLARIIHWTRQAKQGRRMMMRNCAARVLGPENTLFLNPGRPSMLANSIRSQILGRSTLLALTRCTVP